VRNSSTRLQKIQPGWLKTITDFAIGFLPEPHCSQDLRSGAGEDALGVALHHRFSQVQNSWDPLVSDAIICIPPVVANHRESALSQTGQMAANPPLGGANQIDELSYAFLSVKEMLENPKPRRIA
jgi:hypothetical protein